MPEYSSQYVTDNGYTNGNVARHNGSAAKDISDSIVNTYDYGCNPSHLQKICPNMNSDITVAYSDFASLTNGQKLCVIRHLISTKPTFRVLQIMARCHIGIMMPSSESNYKDTLLTQFQSHICTDNCLITVRQALSCGLSNIISLGTSDIRVARERISLFIQKNVNVSQSAVSESVLSFNEASHFVYVDSILLNNYLKKQLVLPLLIKDLKVLSKLHHCSLLFSRDKKSIILNLRNHLCASNCLIQYADAIKASLPIKFNSKTDNMDTARSYIQSYLNQQSLSRQPALNINKRAALNEDVNDYNHLSKRLRTNTPVSDWPQVLSNEEKVNIINEFRDKTNLRSLTQVECSFCGVSDYQLKIHRVPIASLDISFLDKAVENLHLVTRQHLIRSYNPETIVNNNYQICNTCFRCIKNNKFFQVPLYSYSNNCWVGPIPDELKCLSFLEEQCIARARSTRCTVKIEHGPTGQCKAKGNVCILPQEPASLLSVLPPPINVLTDEIVVIFVASVDTEINDDILKKSPLLVRRSYIIQALSWLKKHNPFYEDIEISVNNLMQYYPENGVPEGFAIQQVLKNNMTESEGVSYTTQVNDELFTDSTSGWIFTSSAIVDTECINTTYKLRKLEALKQLKTFNKPFIKFPSSSTPLHTWNNPALYTYLWPTLFPYGVGLLEDPIRKNKNSVFRPIHLKAHVKHLLNIQDKRFQLHTTFIYVMMNIIQRRTAMMESKLACKRTWFPNVSQALANISPESLQNFEKKIQQNKHVTAESESEKSILEILKYVNYISENITGSIAEIHSMREEIRSISREVGLPHLFITINPADFYNPIYQLIAGRDINLDSIFHDMNPSKENIIRAKMIAENPVAGAKGFALVMDNFIDILLGIKRENKIGIFGKVISYYGVVESQHRGSLHCHLFIWLENALGPNAVKQKLNVDMEWKKLLTTWLESIISQDFPPNTHTYSAENLPYQRTPIMSRPLDPKIYFNTLPWFQDIRNVLENTGQIHIHNNTCFKHLPKMLLRHRDCDKDCRFQLPRPLVKDSYFDDTGHFYLKCQNGSLNNYNDVCISCLRCNMDIKYVGSGTAALAMIEYVTNYIAKLSLDTATIFTSLCGAITSIANNPPQIPGTAEVNIQTQSRLLLTKICNSMIGKRELSGQQVASFLCNRPNHYTNHTFKKIFWTKILNFTTNDLFKYKEPTHSDEDCSEIDDTDIINSKNDLEPDTFMILDKSNINENPCPTTISRGTVIDDIFYRPYELEHLNFWDICRNYTRVKLPKHEIRKTNNNNAVPSKIFRFHENHPSYDTYCLKERSQQITLVLIGCSIPRRDDKDKYAAAMLTLFKPWSRRIRTILKGENDSWIQSFENFEPTVKPIHRKIIDNMQSIYECRDAADDFSTQRKQRLNEFNIQVPSSVNVDLEDTYDDDPVWTFGMQDDTNDNSENNIYSNSLNIPLYLSEKEEQQAVDFYIIASNANFYNYSKNTIPSPQIMNTVTEGNAGDIQYARQQNIDLMQQKDFALSLNNGSSINRQDENLHRQNLNRDYLFSNQQHSNIQPYLTTLQDEYRLIQQKLQRENPSQWNKLELYQKFSLALVEKYTFNQEQKIAFLLFADHHGRSLKRNISPMRMLITGPGGTGKSQIFDAIRDYYQLLDSTHQLKICAPTGLASTNIGGSTIHSEASLRIPKKYLYANTPQGQNLRMNLENRFHSTTALICDEIYFLSAKDNNTLSENLNIACQSTIDSIYGNLNILTAGDPAQLPPPCATSLYNHKALLLYNKQDFNTLNVNDKSIAEGIFAFRQIETCIVLQQIMRQKEKDFQDLLNRLRYGNCTYDDYVYLQQFILQNQPPIAKAKFLSIDNWINNRENCSPLICYTNILRDIHNYKCSEAFAYATQQEYHYYYALDTVKKSKVILKNSLAEASWRTPIKQTKDLAGRLPLIPGMPIFLTENLASILGLSNGSEGTIINIKYYMIENRRYAIYATVEFPTYKNPWSNIKQVTIQPINEDIQFKYPQHNKLYTVKRQQLPLIPAFAYTAHNSQGRSLNKACIDISSCPNTAAAYVMLSRIRYTSGISILKPFQFSHISTHIPQEVRNEIDRLQNLHDNTMKLAEKQLQWVYE